DMLQATAQEASTDVEDARAKIQEITDQLAQNDQKLKDATAVRSEEEKEFQASESKLVDAADMLTRAIAALNKAAEGGGTSLAQQSFRSKGLKPVLVGLGAVIEAAEIRSTLPPERLTAMLQELEGAAKDAPGNDKPGSKSNTVIMVMEDMRGKAAEQLEKVRATEAEALHNFRLLKASVERSSANAGTELAEVKSEMSASQERLASTNGELRVVAKLLALAQDALKSSQSACIEAAADHEKSVHDVEAELAALGEAEKLLAEASGSTAYSLAQVSLARSHDGSAARISAAIGREAPAPQTPTGLAPELEELVSSQLICPISHRIMEYAVITPSGHTYDQAALLQWLRRRSVDPLSMEPLAASSLVPNRALHSEVIEQLEKLSAKGVADGDMQLADASMAKLESVRKAHASLLLSDQRHVGRLEWIGDQCVSYATWSRLLLQAHLAGLSHLPLLR
ncbi:unnamed protein product, partial [Prorocentrum cordatum]